MRRMTVVIALTALGLALAPVARAEGTTYTWTIDPPPFGPNVSTSADGHQIQIAGWGVLSDGSVAGLGFYVILDPSGAPVTGGFWSAHGGGEVDDQGVEMEPPVFRAGVLVLEDVDFSGLGEGSIVIECDAGPTGLEGVYVTVGGRTYDRIQVGSTTLVDPAAA